MGWLMKKKTKPLPPLDSVDDVITQLEVELSEAQVLVAELRRRSRAAEERDHD